MRDLKPCPFCGAKAKIGKFLIGCGQCRLFFSFNPKVLDEKDSAIEKWNSRC